MRYHSILLILAATMILAVPVTLSHGQTSSQLFGCQEWGGSMHCDLLLYPMEGIEVIGNSTLVHPLTSSETLFADGKMGQAIEMRGQYRESIEIMGAPDLNPEKFSVSFWIKPTTIEPYSHVVSHSNRGQTAGWQFDTFSTSGPNGAPVSTLRFGIFNSNGTLFSPVDIVLPKDTLVHITGSFDGKTVRLYKDGQLEGQVEFTGTYTAEPGVPLRIGSAAYCSSCNRWSGILDDLRMYNNTLSPNEVALLTAEQDVTEGQVGHWKFDGDTSDAAGEHDGTNTTMLGSMAFAPDGRLFFTEKNSGAIRIMTSDNEILDEPFVSVDDVYASWEQGMLGLAIDPDFQRNRYVYVYYTALVDTNNGEGGKVVNKVVRFTDRNNSGTEAKVLLDNMPASRGFHSGGAMTFGPDDKLYITVGDATEHIFAQDPSIVIGKILRINRDGSIPEDNPYPNSPIYTLGHRNMYGIAFDKASGTGLATENGDFRYDEINIIQKNGNYGFPTMQPPNLPPEVVTNASVKPIRSYWDTIAPTMMIYYTGDAVPELKNMFLFGSFTGDIYALRLSDDNKHVVQEIKVELAHFPFVPTVGIAQSPDGKIYYGGYQIYTLDSIGESEQLLFPLEVTAPETVNIAEVRVNEEQQSIVLGASVNGTISPDSKMTVKIPKSLMENITNVGVEDQNESNIEFTVDGSDPNFNTVSIGIISAVANNSLNLVISGASGTVVVPEFSPTTLAVILVSIMAATLTIRKKGWI